MAMDTTTSDVLNQLVAQLAANYEAELANMPIKKQLKDCLIDGFKAGAHSGVFHACKMLEITVLGK